MKLFISSFMLVSFCFGDMYVSDSDRGNIYVYDEKVKLITGTQGIESAIKPNSNRGEFKKASIDKKNIVKDFYEKK